jgi:beta-glucosidase
MAERCRDHGLIPAVTFHHFTNPRWVAARGRWKNRETAKLFVRARATGA